MPPACENRSRASSVARMHGNAGLHARQRRVACAATPGRLYGLANAVSTFGHFSGILERITQKTERKQQVDGLPFALSRLMLSNPAIKCPKAENLLRMLLERGIQGTE